MSRRPYSYSVLRYVHDIVTGEFVNVGIVFLAPGQDAHTSILLCEFKDRIQRLRSLFPNIDRLGFVSSIAAIRRASKEISKQVATDGLFASSDARAVALRMLPHDGSSLQWSEVGTGIAKDLNKEFSRISDRMLSAYDTHTESRKSNEDVWRPVKQALAERRIAIEFEPKVIRGRVDSIEFSHSWKNGRIHAYEPLSFDLTDAENIKDKARRWVGHLSTVNIEASDEFKAYFIAGCPSDERLMTAYHAALDILRSAPTSPEVFEEAEVEDLVNSIEDEYRQHQTAA